MSDGPHRSLGLRRPWRKLAKLCDNAAYAPAEVTHAATAALVSDFNEVSAALLKALKSVFACEGNSLGSPEIAMHQLNLARALAAGSVFGQYAIKSSQMHQRSSMRKGCGAWARPREGRGGHDA